MIEPGFSPGGSRSQMARFSGDSLKMPPANTLRDWRWVRFGPTLPPDTPLTVWQPAQPLVVNRSRPAAAVEPWIGVVGFASCAASQASKAALVWAIALFRMLACDA